MCNNKQKRMFTSLFSLFTLFVLSPKAVAFTSRPICRQFFTAQQSMAPALRLTPKTTLKIMNELVRYRSEILTFAANRTQSADRYLSKIENILNYTEELSHWSFQQKEYFVSNLLHILSKRELIRLIGLTNKLIDEHTNPPLNRTASAERLQRSKSIN